MRGRLWHRNQRERAIQKVLDQIRNKTWFYWSHNTPVPHQFLEREEWMNQHPALDHWIPPKTWEDVFEGRREQALLRHGSRCPYSRGCGNPRRWWGQQTLGEIRANISENEWNEELGLLYQNKRRRLSYGYY